VLLIVGVTWALGGFDEVVPAEQDVVPVAVGEEVNGGPWLVTIESAEVGYNLRGETDFSDDPTLVLQVNARIEIIDQRTRSVFGLDPPLELQDVPGVQPGQPTTRSLRDNSTVTDLQPGLPVRIAYLWRLEPNTPVPDEVTVVVNILERRYESWRFSGTVGEFPIQAAAVTVPVQDRTAA
jgi:hypothetical protein